MSHSPSSDRDSVVEEIAALAFPEGPRRPTWDEVLTEAMGPMPTRTPTSGTMSAEAVNAAITEVTSELSFLVRSVATLS